MAKVMIEQMVMRAKRTEWVRRIARALTILADVGFGMWNVVEICTI